MKRFIGDFVDWILGSGVGWFLLVIVFVLVHFGFLIGIIMLSGIVSPWFLFLLPVLLFEILLVCFVVSERL